MNFSSFIAYLDFYKDLFDGNIKEKVDTFYNTLVLEYKDILEKQKDTLNDLMNFKLSYDNFDIDNYNELKKKMDSSYLVESKMSNLESLKQFKIEVSYLIYEFLNLDFTKENYIKLYDLCYGSYEHSGILLYLDSYFYTKEQRADIYKLDLFYEKYEKLSSLEEEYLEYLYSLIDEVIEVNDELRFISDDFTLYQEIINMYDNYVGFSLDYNKIDLIYLIKARLQMNEFNNKYNLVKDNISNDDFKVLIDLENQLNMNFIDLSLVPEYEIYSASLDLFNQKREEIQNSLLNYFNDLSYDNILNQYDEFKNYYDSNYNVMISTLYVEENNNIYINFIKIYDAVAYVKLFKEALSLDLNETNYEAIFKLIYDSDKIIDFKNEFMYDSDFNYIVSKFIDTELNLKLEDLIKNI